MNAITLSENISVFNHLKNDEAGTFYSSYLIEKFVAYHDVSQALWSDRKVAENLLKQIHDEKLDRQECTRVNEIKIIEMPEGEFLNGIPPSSPTSRWVATISRAIKAKL